MTQLPPPAPGMGVATDAAIFTVQSGRLKLLLIQMKKAPYQGVWALPGGRLNKGETSMVAASRVLASETGLTKAHLEQLATFDEPDRDPFGRVVSVAYMALVPPDMAEPHTSDKYESAAWHDVAKLPKTLAYDHKHIAAVALTRLRNKLEYTDIARSLLNAEFTLAELQTAYESVLAKKLDKRNFLKKMLAREIVKPTGKKRSGAAHRPAELYRFPGRGPAPLETVK